jgi:hypothetical protein
MAHRTAASRVEQGVEAMKNRTIIMSDEDHRRLAALIESARYDASLREDDLTALEGVNPTMTLVANSAEASRTRGIPSLEFPSYPDSG